MKTLKVLACLVLIVLLCGCVSTGNEDDEQGEAGVVSGTVENPGSQAKVTYNVRDANLGELTTPRQDFHQYLRGGLNPGQSFRLWGTIENKGRYDNELMIRVRITIWSSDHPHGNDVVDTGILLLYGGSTYEYDYTVDIPANAHQVDMAVETTASGNTNWKAQFKARLTVDE